MVVKTAIRPNYFKDFREVSTLKTEKKDDQDIHLHSLSKHAGWKILEDYIDGLIRGLDLMVISLIEQGADAELIGQKTIAKEIAKEILIGIKNKVYDAKVEIEPDARK